MLNKNKLVYDTSNVLLQYSIFKEVRSLECMSVSVSPLSCLFFIGDSGHEPRGHLGSGAAAFWTVGPEDRVSDAERRGARAHHADPLAEDERLTRHELRGARALH